MPRSDLVHRLQADDRPFDDRDPTLAAAINTSGKGFAIVACPFLRMLAIL